MVSTISFGWFADFGKIVTNIERSSLPLPVHSDKINGKHSFNKKLFRAYNRAFTKNDEAGLERNRFYFRQYVVAINEKVIYRFSVCVSDYILCIAWV